MVGAAASVVVDICSDKDLDESRAVVEEVTHGGENDAAGDAASSAAPVRERKAQESFMMMGVVVEISALWLPYTSK